MSYFQKVFTVHQHKLTASSRFGQSKIKVIFFKTLMVQRIEVIFYPEK